MIGWSSSGPQPGGAVGAPFSHFSTKSLRPGSVSAETEHGYIFFPSAARNSVWIPARFLGLSVEKQHLCALLSKEQQDLAVVNMLHSLNLGIVRIGGTSQDRMAWNGAASCGSPGPPVISRGLVNRFAAFARQYPWHIIWGLDLGANNPGMSAEEAKYVSGALGKQVLAFAIGNEPDWFYGLNPPLRTKPYKTRQYEREWEGYALRIRDTTPGAPLMGPSTSWPSLGNPGSLFRSFLVHEPIGTLLYASAHYYPTAWKFPGLAAATLTNLLSRELRADTAARLGGAVAIARSRKLRFILDESNSAASGGVNGVSNSLGGAVWAVDYLLTAMKVGVAAVAIHEGDGQALYSPIELRTGKAQSMYYAMKFFQIAVQGGGSLIPLDVLSPANVTAYAVRQQSGDLRIVVINKNMTVGVRVRVFLPGSQKKGLGLRLAGPSAAATTGITLGQSQVSARGLWCARAIEQYVIRDATVSLALDPSSALLVDFPASGRRSNLQLCS